MNLLAHAYLSFNHPEILTGNMISDYVKGKTKFDYPSGVQKGIALHRAIDEFTDAHPATKKAKEFFRPAYRLYSGAFIDVVYDHFLANDKNEFKEEAALYDFSLQVYQVLQVYFSILPQQFQKMLPHMQQHNWLYNYRQLSGIDKSFAGLAYRAAYINESATAFSLFTENYSALKTQYDSFFPELKNFSQQTLSNLLHA